MTNDLNCNKIDKPTCVCGSFHLLSAAKIMAVVAANFVRCQLLFKA